MTAVDDFLDAIEGTTIPYVELAEDAKNPYCDSCSSPIRPNNPVQLYATDKLLTGHEVRGGFRALRLHCEDCRLPRLYFPAQGFAEYLVDATIDTEWTIHDPTLVDVSPPSDGLAYDPKTIIEDLFEMDYQQVMAITGYESQGPLDAIDLLVVVDIDPREVVADDGTITVTDAHRAQFHEEGMEIMEQHEKGGPPQPSVADKLRAFLDTEEPDE